MYGAVLAEGPTYPWLITGTSPSAVIVRVPPAALTQGLRDFFGAHTYGRIDEDPSKKFHTLWSADRTEVPA